jgi:AraC-like DNA-binding protein
MLGARRIPRFARKMPQFDSLPTASGGIARAAYAWAEERLELAPLLKQSGLTVQQIKNPRIRLAVKKQIKFLNLVAAALHEEFLGILLAEDLDLRELGLLYYVLASSETLGDALRRVARYSSIQNEGLRITYRDRKETSIIFEYFSVARLSDVHQMEFFVTTLLRTCRQLTGRHLSPNSVRLKHPRGALPAKFKGLFGCEVEFGKDADEVVYPQHAKNIPVVNADPYLNSILLKYCEEALSRRLTRSGAWRLNVENIIAPLLPHGLATMAEIAQRLGVSQRTLARRLASEGVTFVEVLKNLRIDLAHRYLREPGEPISEVAWLLGYREISAFNHAFKRWTGKTPRQVRSARGNVVPTSEFRQH